MLRTDTVPTAAKTGTFRMFAKHTFVSTMHLVGTIMMKLRKLLILFNCTVQVSIYDTILRSSQQRAYNTYENRLFKIKSCTFVIFHESLLGIKHFKDTSLYKQQNR